MNKKKYNDEFSRLNAIRLLRILSPSIKKLRDYQFDDRDSTFYIYKFYVPLIKHDPNLKGNVLDKLSAFCHNSNSKIRFYIDNSSICIEVSVPKPKASL